VILCDCLVDIFGIKIVNENAVKGWPEILNAEVYGDE
jgi:hypothetical protein